MTIKIAKLPAILWIGLSLCCCMTLPLAAQQRTGGGGTGGGGGGFGGGGGGLGGGGGGAGGAGRSGGAASTATTVDRTPTGEVGNANFFVDPDSRTVVITADSNTAAYVSQVISNMDRPKPQVLIKVVFLQVTYNNGYDVGLEGGITKRLNTTTTLSASNLFNLANQGITPTSGVNTLPGAGLYTIVGNDFEATVRAIQEVGKVDVLSRPTILARNNQQATVQVGQNVPIITGVNVGALGNETSTVAYQPVGVILQVTPFISSDNMVEMILAPSISSVASQSTVISTGSNGIFSTPYINIESANTVVVTPNGQTVAIGGLMQDNKTTTDSKIPLLGDIPGLGLLFHHKVSSVNKTELIIFLTPYVIRTPDDLVRMTLDEKSRVNMSQKAFPAKEMNQYLSPQPPPPGTAPASGSPHTHS
jgi:general secretion pathway protein D